MANLKTCNITPSINITLNFEYENGYVKTVTLKEGQLVKNLVYVKNGEEKTITGIFKLINFISKQGISAKDDCIHDDKSNFDKFVSVTTLNIDCSEQYKFNIIQVPVKFIKDIEIVEDVEIKPAVVNGVEYDSIISALAAAEDGATVTLADDFQSEEKVYLADGKAVTLDLNGHKLYVPEVEDNYGCIVKGDATINGDGNVVAGGAFGIGVQPKGTLTINSGVFKTSGTYLIGSWGKTIINGGEFNSSYCCVNGFDGEVIINGGNFVAEKAENDPEWGWTVILGNVKVMGGTFSHPVHERYCADGYKPKTNADGTYTVEAIVE